MKKPRCARDFHSVIYLEPGNAIAGMRVHRASTINRIETALFASNNILSWLVSGRIGLTIVALSFSHVGYNTRRVRTHNCRRKRFSAYLKIHNTYIIYIYRYLHNIFYSCMSRAAAFVPKRPVNLFPIVFRARIYLSTNALIFTRPDAVFNVISDKQPTGGSYIAAARTTLRISVQCIYDIL